jgi:hypothetical protein
LKHHSSSYIPSPCILKIELDGTLAVQKLRKSLTGEKRFRSMFIGDNGEFLPKVQ